VTRSVTAFLGDPPITGALIRELGVPVVAVHEGGYHLATLGGLTVAALAGLTGARRPQ